jgi:hypothetical protein
MSRNLARTHAIYLRIFLCWDVFRLQKMNEKATDIVILMAQEHVLNGLEFWTGYHVVYVVLHVDEMNRTLEGYNVRNW